MDYRKIKSLISQTLQGISLLSVAFLLAFSALTIYSNWRGASAQWQMKAQQISIALQQERNARGAMIGELKGFKSLRTDKVINKYFAPATSKTVN